MYTATLGNVPDDAQFYTGRGRIFGLIGVEGPHAFIQGPVDSSVQEMSRVPADLAVDVLEPEHDKEMESNFMNGLGETVEPRAGLELVAISTLPPNSVGINERKTCKIRVLRQYPASKQTQVIGLDGSGRAYCIKSETMVYPEEIAPEKSAPAPTSIISRSEQGEKKATRQLARGNFNADGKTTKPPKVQSISKEDMPEGYDMTADMVSVYYGAKKVVITWRARHGWFAKGGVNPVKVGNEWYFKSDEVSKYKLTPEPAQSYLLPEGPKSLEEVLAAFGVEETAETEAEE